MFVGNNRPADAGLITAQAGILSVASSFFIAATGILCAPHILTLMNAGPELAAQGIPYLTLYFITALPISVMFLLFEVLRCAGNAAATSVIYIGTAAVHAAAAWLLIPMYGVVGASAAWLVSRTLGATASLIFAERVSRKNDEPSLSFSARDFIPDMRLMGMIIEFGVFRSLQSGIEWAGGMVYLAIIGACGPAAIACFGVASRITALPGMLIAGIGYATKTMFSQNLGRRAMERARASVRMCMYYGLAAAAALGIPILIWAPDILSPFSADASMRAAELSFISIIIPSYAGVVSLLVLKQTFIGALDMKSPAVFSAATVAFAVLLTSYLAFTAGMGLAGVWWGFGIANLASGGLMALWYRLHLPDLQKNYAQRVADQEAKLAAYAGRIERATARRASREPLLSH